MARGQNRTAAQKPALAETLGLDGGLLQTAISTPGATGTPPGRDTYTQHLFRSKLLKTGGRTGADANGPRARAAAVGTPDGAADPRSTKAHGQTDTPRSQPDTKKCIQVGSETYAVMSQPGTPYTFHDYDSLSVIDSSSPNVPVDSGKKKRLGQRARKTRNKNPPN